MSQFCEERRMTLSIPPSQFCTDNAIMIANAGLMRLSHDLAFPDGLYLETEPVWPLSRLKADS
jgi:tRNA A37 threonylcarbamoyltransferase TsaD